MIKEIEIEIDLDDVCQFIDDATDREKEAIVKALDIDPEWDQIEKFIDYATDSELERIRDLVDGEVNVDNVTDFIEHNAGESDLKEIRDALEDKLPYTFNNNKNFEKISALLTEIEQRGFLDEIEQIEKFIQGLIK